MASVRPPSGPASTGAPPGGPPPDGARLLFLQTQGDPFRRVAWTSVDGNETTARVSDLECQRIHYAGGRGLCAGTTFAGGAFIFDRELRPVAQLRASGLASRARVSADGRFGSMTFFVRGDSYADAGFSTRTTIIDMANATDLGDLETFTVLRDGTPFRSLDFNFWGVSFAPDSDRFYATLGTRSETFLVSGNVVTRQLRVLRANAECPSVSPDGSRLVFKKRLPEAFLGRVSWRLAALDLATMTETPLAETRSVDDQVEWIDNDRILYSLPDAGPPATIRPDLWLLDLRGGTPGRFQIGAMSPAIGR